MTFRALQEKHNTSGLLPMSWFNHFFHGDADGDGMVLGVSGYEVLLGQRECVNHMRATRDNPHPIMRYPGEWGFPGGSRDAGDATLLATGVRELREEFLGLAVPRGARLRLFNTMTTKAIRGRSYKMTNFAAIAEAPGNAWLRDADVAAVNARLARRRAAFAAAVADGSFFALPRARKAALAPEVRRVAWMDLGDACEMLLLSRLGPDGVLCDAWQREQFEALGIARRDPMFVSLWTLVQIDLALAAAASADAAAGGGGVPDIGEAEAFVSDASERYEHHGDADSRSKL